MGWSHVGQWQVRGQPIARACYESWGGLQATLEPLASLLSLLLIHMPLWLHQLTAVGGSFPQGRPVKKETSVFCVHPNLYFCYYAFVSFLNILPAAWPLVVSLWCHQNRPSRCYLAVSFSPKHAFAGCQERALKHQHEAFCTLTLESCCFTWCLLSS